MTKAQQRHILNDRMTLIDSPGLLWPKIEHPVVGLMLATIYAVTAKVVDDEEIAEFLATTLLARYPGLLAARYGCVEDGLDGAGVLEAIAIKRGCLRKGKGGELDRDKAAKILLTEYRNGTLGRTSLETPDTSADSDLVSGYRSFADFSISLLRVLTAFQTVGTFIHLRISMKVTKMPRALCAHQIAQAFQPGFLT